MLLPFLQEKGTASCCHPHKDKPPRPLLSHPCPSAVLFPVLTPPAVP